MRFVLFLVAALISVAPAHAGAVHSFQFQNVDGAVAGTVSGRITLNGFGDGTFAATSIIVDSAPAALGYSLPYDVMTFMPDIVSNVFVVSGGQIDKANSQYWSWNPDEAFFLGVPGGLGSLFSKPGLNDLVSGVVDANNLTETYSAPAVVPEPSTAVGLALFGLIGGGLRRLQRMRRSA